MTRFSLLLLILTVTAVHAVEDRPNVLMIIVDDLRPELGIYGAPIQTPHMDKLGQAGVVFDRAYCNSAVCGASRASLLTGIRPGRHRFLRYDTSVRKEAPGEEVLPATFQQAGYRTISIGKVFHHRSDGEQAWDVLQTPGGKSSWRDYLHEENIALDDREDGRGPFFEIYEGDEAYRDERIADKAIEQLQWSKESGQPFFMATGFVKPHLPFNAPKAYWDLYEREEFRIPESYTRLDSIPEQAYHRFGELRSYSGIPDDQILSRDLALHLIHGYYAATSYVDAQIGRVLDSLDQLGLRENTVVLLFGDHGFNLGEHTLWCKHCNFDHAMRVPLIIDAPGYAEGARAEALVELLDIYPTLIDLADLPAPEGQLEGVSLVPILENPELEGKGFIVSKYREGISLRTDQYLYTEWQNRADGKVKARTLFDLKADPQEMRNLVDAEEYQDRLEDFAGQLRAKWGDRFEEKPGAGE